MDKIIFMSPHPDDVVLSCGEYIKKLIDNNLDVLVITVFTGLPPKNSITNFAREFHMSCGLDDNVMYDRKIEDILAMKKLGAKFTHLDKLECLYRTNTDFSNRYYFEEEIYSKNINKELDTIECLNNIIYPMLKEYKVKKIFVPLGIGDHIDHTITKNCIEKLVQDMDIDIYYYEDTPYVCSEDEHWTLKLDKDLIKSVIPITDEEWLCKMEALKCYKSQIKMLWQNDNEMNKQLNEYSSKYLFNKHSIRVWGKKVLM